MTELTRKTRFKLSQAWKGQFLSHGTSVTLHKLRNVTQNLEQFKNGIEFCVKNNETTNQYVVHEDGLTLEELSKLIKDNDKLLSINNHIEQADNLIYANGRILSIYEHLKEAERLAKSMDMTPTKVIETLEFISLEIKNRLDHTLDKLNGFAPVGCVLGQIDGTTIRFVEKED